MMSQERKFELFALKPVDEEDQLEKSLRKSYEAVFALTEGKANRMAIFSELAKKDSGLVTRALIYHILMQVTPKACDEAIEFASQILGGDFKIAVETLYVIIREKFCKIEKEYVVRNILALVRYFVEKSIHKSHSLFPALSHYTLLPATRKYFSVLEFVLRTLRSQFDEWFIKVRNVPLMAYSTILIIKLLSIHSRGLRNRNSTILSLEYFLLNRLLPVPEAEKDKEDYARAKFSEPGTGQYFAPDKELIWKSLGIELLRITRDIVYPENGKGTLIHYLLEANPTILETAFLLPANPVVLKTSMLLPEVFEEIWATLPVTVYRKVYFILKEAPRVEYVRYHFDWVYREFLQVQKSDNNLERLSKHKLHLDILRFLGSVFGKEEKEDSLRRYASFIRYLIEKCDERILSYAFLALFMDYFSAPRGGGMFVSVRPSLLFLWSSDAIFLKLVRFTVREAPELLEKMSEKILPAETVRSNFFANLEKIPKDIQKEIYVRAKVLDSKLDTEHDLLLRFMSYLNEEERVKPAEIVHLHKSDNDLPDPAVSTKFAIVRSEVERIIKDLSENSLQRNIDSVTDALRKLYRRGKSVDEQRVFWEFLSEYYFPIEEDDLVSVIAPICSFLVDGFSPSILTMLMDVDSRVAIYCIWHTLFSDNEKVLKSWCLSQQADKIATALVKGIRSLPTVFFKSYVSLYYILKHEQNQQSMTLSHLRKMLRKYLVSVKFIVREDTIQYSKKIINFIQTELLEEFLVNTVAYFPTHLLEDLNILLFQTDVRMFGKNLGTIYNSFMSISRKEGIVVVKMLFTLLTAEFQRRVNNPQRSGLIIIVIKILRKFSLEETGLNMSLLYLRLLRDLCFSSGMQISRDVIIKLLGFPMTNPNLVEPMNFIILEIIRYGWYYEDSESEEEEEEEQEERVDEEEEEEEDVDYDEYESEEMTEEQVLEKLREIVEEYKRVKSREISSRGSGSRKAGAKKKLDEKLALMEKRIESLAEVRF